MVTSFRDIVLGRRDTSADHSTAAPFQQHQLNMAGGVPSLPTGGVQPEPARSGPSLEELLADLQPGDPRETQGLRSARDQLQSSQDLATAVGLDETGEADQGFLSAAFGLIDLPRASVFNFARGLADPEMGLPEIGQAIADREGFGDLDAIQFEDDDTTLVRGLKGTAALAGDIATDPLAYFTFGAASVGKKAGTEAVQRLVAQRAPGELGEQTVRRWSERTLRERARRAARDQDLSSEAQQALQHLQRPPAGVADEAAWRLQTGADQLGSAAAEAFQVRGATGLREFMERLGPEGRRLWEKLPVDIKGGARLRIPFAKQEGVRRAIPLAGGGGQLGQAIGLGPAANMAHSLRNAARASKASQAFHRGMNTADGDLYGKMAADLVHAGRKGTPESLAGTTYEMFRVQRAARRAGQEARRGIRQTGSKAGARAAVYVDGAPDPDEAKRAFDDWFMRPQDLDEVRRAGGVEIDEAGRYHVLGGPQNLSDSEARGVASALEIHDTFGELRRQAVDAGLSVGDINDYYMPRILTEMAREQKRRRKPIYGRGAGTVEGHDPTRQRQRFLEPQLAVAEDGTSTVTFRHLTNREANERVRQLGDDVTSDMFFVEDPEALLSGYMDGLERLVSRAAYTKTLRESGALVEAGVEAPLRIAPRAVSDALEQLDPAVDTLQGMSELAEAATASRDALRVAASQIGETSNVREQQRIIQQLMEGMSETSGRLDTWRKMAREDFERVSKASEEFRGLVRRVRRAEANPDDDRAVRSGVEALEELETHGLSLEAAQERAATLTSEAEWLRSQARTAGRAATRFRQARRTAAGAEGRARQVDEGGVALQDLGLEQLGQGDQHMIGTLPPELSVNFAPEAMRQSVEKFFRVQQEPAAIQQWIDGVYRPFLTMFKATATIGRGPGFHIRNAVGGMWNNWLMDVSVADHRLAAQLTSARRQAGNTARREQVDKIMASRGLSRREASKHVPEEAVEQRVEELLQQSLGDVRVNDNWNMYDVHRASLDQDIGWRQGHHATLSEEQLEELTTRGVGSTGRAQERKQNVLFPEARTRSQRTANRMANMWWIRHNGDMASMTESYLRNAGFIQGLRRYNDPQTASMIPRATQFDYQDLADWERRWLRGFALPFYTWTRRNVPLQFRGLVQNPGKMNQLNRAVVNAEEAFGDDDIDLVPEWMQDRMGFVSRFQFDGNPIVLGPETPAKDLNELFKVAGPVDSAQQFAMALMSASSPALQVPVQFAAGTELFTGAALDAQAGRSAPWWYRAAAATGAVPLWYDEDGDAVGDARIITSMEGSVPWLNQAEKLAATLGAGSKADRSPTEAIRQFAPVVSAMTLTPEQEAGQTYGQVQRLRTQLDRQDHDDVEQARALLDMGLPPEQVRQILGLGG